MKQPFLYTTIAYIIGLLIGKIISFPVWYLVICFILFTGVIIYFLNYAKKRDVSLFLILCLIAMFGIFRMNVVDSRQSRNRNFIDKFIGIQRLEIEGEIISDPIAKKDYLRFEIGKINFFFKNFKIKFPGKIRVYVKESAYEGFQDKTPSYGDKISIDTTLVEPEEATTEDLFDYKEYLERMDIYAVTFIKYPESILNFQIEHKPFEMILGIKHRIKRYFYKDMGDEDASLLLAMLFGEKIGLEKSQKDKFIRCGIMHIFAVSGLHIGIAIVIFFFTLRILQVKRSITSIITILFIILYAMLTGFRPSVVRASIIGICYMLSFLVKREPSPYNVLSFSAFILLLFEPRLLYQASFQLSFLAVIGILLMTTKMLEVIKFKPYFIRNTIIGSASAQIFVLPLVIHYFNVLSIIGYASNILVIPILFGIIYIAFFSLIFGFIIPPIGSLFNEVNSLLLSIIRIVTDFFSSLSISAIHYPNLSYPVIFLYYFMIGYILYKWKSEKWSKTQKGIRLLILFLALIVLLFFNYWITTPRAISELTGSSDTLEITFLDIGQGDCTYFEFPDGKNMIVDGGPGEAGKYIVEPFLMKRGVNTINCMLLTHPDADHLSGLCDVVKTFNVDLCLANGDMHTTDLYIDFLKYIKEHKIDFRILRRWDRIDMFENIEMYVIHPDEENFDFYSGNSKSVVFKLIYKDFSILMCGDIENEAEYNIINTGFDLKSDVLKVPHHGSSSSTTTKFLNAVKPKVAIIEVGRHNRFGHPREEVLKRLEKIGATIYRTDLNGTIKLITDGYEMKIIPTKTYSEKKF